MKITKLIEYFIFLEEKYQTALTKKYTIQQLRDNHLDEGFCNCIIEYKKKNWKFCYLFSFKGYYREYLNAYGFLFKIPFYIVLFNRTPTKEIKKSLQFRLNFIQEEIKSLNSLLKEGYTHV